MQKLLLNLKTVSKTKNKAKNKKLKLVKKDKKEKKKIDIKELNFLKLLETKKQNPKKKIDLLKKSQTINTNNKSVLEEIIKNKLLSKSYNLLESKDKALPYPLTSLSSHPDKAVSHTSKTTHPVNFIVTPPPLSKAQGGEFSHVIPISQPSSSSSKDKALPYPPTSLSAHTDKAVSHTSKTTHVNFVATPPSLSKAQGGELSHVISSSSKDKALPYPVTNLSSHTDKAVTRPESVTSYKTMESVKIQLQNSIKYMSQNNRKQVVLKLNPEHLGKLEINISMIKKSTKVEIKVQKHETLELLQNNQTSLKNLFSEIKKTSNDISFSFDKNTNSESNSDSNQQKRKKYQEIEEKFNYLEDKTISSYVGLIEIIV